MAWIAFSMIVLSGVYLLGFAEESKLKAIDGILDMYWIGLVSIVGFYFGATAFFSNKK